MTVKYTPDHEWINIDGNSATVGITHHAQDALGDVVFVDLPEVGKSYAAKDAAAVVESVKAAADVYMPANGTVTEVNEALRADPSLANSDPLGAGWFFKMTLDNPAQLDGMMDETSYTSLRLRRTRSVLHFDPQKWGQSPIHAELGSDPIFARPRLFELSPTHLTSCQINPSCPNLKTRQSSSPATLVSAPPTKR
jgi:glycine cleavage system H protein